MRHAHVIVTPEANADVLSEPQSLRGLACDLRVCGLRHRARQSVLSVQLEICRICGEHRPPPIRIETAAVVLLLPRRRLQMISISPSSASRADRLRTGSAHG